MSIVSIVSICQVSEAQLRELMNYLNLEEPEEEREGVALGKGMHGGEQAQQRSSLSRRFGALLAPVQQAKSTHHFREFQRVVQVVSSK